MLTQEQSVEIKVMASRGVSIREMAKQLTTNKSFSLDRYVPGDVC